ncbi:MAG: nuclear transport factor 2 family protein [Acidimicrobiales bacterium]|nr:nuclear transport factor 2 family protein [Hyphomonadaceae bacterium]RZV34948.1 MAG: nuclear transport factor 2 family protein [Acidimicrobiales bacterium]
MVDKKYIFQTLVLSGIIFGGGACTKSKALSPIFDSSQALVQSYSDAYNAKNLVGMTALMHDDIEWINLEGSDLTIITVDKDSLVSELKSYFNGDSKASIRLSDWSTNGEYVSVKETVSFTLKDGSEVSQASLSVYELDDGLIRRVWYFPAQ